MDSVDGHGPRPYPEPKPCDPRVRPHLVCPLCRGELEDAPGWLACGACSVRWPVVDGVPWLIPEEAVRVRVPSKGPLR